MSEGDAMKTIWLAVMLAGCGGGAFEDASPSQAQERGGAAGHVGKIGGIEPVMGVGGAGSGGSTTLPGGAGGTPTAAGMAGASGAGQAGGGMAGSPTAGGAGAPGGIGGAPAKGGGVAGNSAGQGGSAGLGGSPDVTGGAGAGGEVAPVCVAKGTYALSGTWQNGTCDPGFAYKIKAADSPWWAVTFDGFDTVSFPGWKFGESGPGTVMSDPLQIDGCRRRQTFFFHFDDGSASIGTDLTFGSDDATGTVEFGWSTSTTNCFATYTVTGHRG